MLLQFYADANGSGSLSHILIFVRDSFAAHQHRIRIVCAVWYAYSRRHLRHVWCAGARFVRCAVGYGYMSLPCVCVCSIRVGFTLSVPYDNGQHDHTLSVVQAGRSACVQAGGTCDTSGWCAQLVQCAVGCGLCACVRVCEASVCVSMDTVCRLRCKHALCLGGL